MLQWLPVHTDLWTGHDLHEGNSTRIKHTLLCISVYERRSCLFGFYADVLWMSGWLNVSLRECGWSDEDVLIATLWWFVWTGDFSASVDSDSCSAHVLAVDSVSWTLIWQIKRRMLITTLSAGPSAPISLSSLCGSDCISPPAHSVSLGEPSSAHQLNFTLLTLFLPFNSNVSQTIWLFTKYFKGHFAFYFETRFLLKFYLIGQTDVMSPSLEE